MMARILVLWSIANVSAASMDGAYQEGRGFSNELQSKEQAAIGGTNVQDVPGFVTAEPSEVYLDKDGNFSDAIRQSFQADSVGTTLEEIAKTRQRFKLDVNKDPLFKGNDGKSAEAELDISLEQGLDEIGLILKTCEEGGDSVTYDCYENRIVTPQVPLKTITLTVNHLGFRPRIIERQVMSPIVNRYGAAEPGSWSGVWGTETVQDGYSVQLPKDIAAFQTTFCHNFTPQDYRTGTIYNLDCQRIKEYKINNPRSISEVNGIVNIITHDNSINITLIHDTFEGEAIDEWITSCDNLENLVEEGLCVYGERALSQGPETRNIAGYQIFKDAWQYKQIYHCKMIKDECSALRAEGCHQVGSRCKEERENRCWIFEQRYQCPNGKVTRYKAKAPLDGIFCLTGSCHNSSYDANNEMLDVIARLSMLKEIQDDMRLNEHNLHIFTGREKRCTRNCVSFKDCCGGLKGWGVSLHIAGCTEEEQQLAKMREQNLCHQVGTFCAKKILGKCVSKKTSFCCFGNKFARLLQEQGRAQLGIGWGEAENPDCRGFTVEELSRMDLSKMDFRELFADIMQKYHAPDRGALQASTTQKITENLQQIESGLKRQELGPKAGVLDGNKQNL